MPNQSADSLNFMKVSIRRGNRSRSLTTLINQIALYTFCAWFMWPYLNFRAGNNAGIILFSIWFITTDLKWLTRKLTKDLLFLGVFLFTFVPYILTNTLRFGTLNPISIFGAIFLFFSGIYIIHYYMYYKQNGVILRRIAFFSLLFCTLGAIQTFLGLQLYPNASRSFGISLFNSIGIGGYSYIFSIVFLLLAMFFFFRISLKIANFARLILVAITVLFIVVIVKSGYATAILLVAFGWLLLLSRKKYLIFSVIFVLFLFFVFDGKYLVGEIMLSSAPSISNQDLRRKVIEFSDVFLERGEAVQALYRWSLYRDSINAFLKNPFFGIYGPLGVYSQPGRHAGWLDMMADYGLFSTIPMFFTIGLAIKKQLSFYKNSAYVPYYLVSAICFLLLGFLKSNLYSYQIGLVMFLVVPSIPFLLNEGIEGFK